MSSKGRQGRLDEQDFLELESEFLPDLENTPVTAQVDSVETSTLVSNMTYCEACKRWTIASVHRCGPSGVNRIVWPGRK